MNSVRNLALCTVAILVSVPLSHAQTLSPNLSKDLSTYRTFDLGMSLSDVSKQISEKPSDAIEIQSAPASLQELAFWPPPPYLATALVDPVQEIRFSFFNGQLFKIAATYSTSSTQGLTALDLVAAISAKYGPASQPVAEAVHTAPPDVAKAGKTIASWENAGYSLTLSPLAFSGAFQLVMISKQISAQADASIAEAAILEREDAPQREVARLKKTADDLESTREKNLKAFQP